MASYVILSRFSPEAFREPKDFRKLADEVSSKIKKECKGVTWKQSFAPSAVSTSWILSKRTIPKISKKPR